MPAKTVWPAQALRAPWHQLRQDEHLGGDDALAADTERVMSPRPPTLHRLLASILAGRFKDQLAGSAMPEVAVMTRTADGREPDMVRMPPEFTR